MHSRYLITLLLTLCVICTSALAQDSSTTAPTNVKQATLKTDLGDIVLELYPEQAPKTVANFVQYAESGFYDGTIFHRVVPGFVVQGGGLTFDFVKKETRAPVVNESFNGLDNLRGTVAMARLPDPDSATSQFFINLKNNRSLNSKNEKAGYTVFAKVISGMDIADEMTKQPQGKYRHQAPDLAIRILDVIVE